jgi:HK97 family phage prohead protease
MAQALDKMYTQATIEKGSFNDEERSFVAWASKPVQDRDGEIIAHNAWDLKNYEKNKVLLWAHNYNLPPVGKVQWLKQQKNGLKFKPIFAPTDMGKELYLLYKDEFLNTFSVGFDPKDFEDDEEKTVEFIGWFGEKFEKPLRTWTDVELLEISCVPVPSCPAALVERMASGQIKTKALKKAINDTRSKTVIPFKKYDLDPEDAEWDGTAERKEADTDDLLVMSTWYDSEDEDVKASYKLPHHRADGHNTVWRGVAAAMVALLGGRGGVDIPDGDRRGVYAHLSKHYSEFDKDVPEFKHYNELDLKAMDPNPIIETIETSAGNVEGGWEAIEVEERDAVEAMRQEGLAREKDGIVPVSTELWNEMLDSFAAIREKEITEIPETDIETEKDFIEISAEDIIIMTQQELKIKQKDESIKKLVHAYKLIKAKYEVLTGGIG